jgi:chemotaxis protein MotC
MRRTFLCIAMLASASAVHAAGVIEALKPGQTLDALQRVQDSIAIGDASALPLQAELITIMDKSFAAALNSGNRETMETELVLAYALAGGSRAVFSSFVKRTKIEAPQRELVEAISAYLEGEAEKAQDHFEKVDVQTLGPRIAPFVALAKGTANIREHPDVAIRHFELARVMSPGTLIEEVALRRMIALHMQSGNAVRFLRASEQYARRFIKSPYAAQFAESFVSGTVSMNKAFSDAEIESVLRAVPALHRNALYLRLAREALIAGRLPLAAFAAASAVRDGESIKDPARAAQIELYAIIAELTKAGGPSLLQRIAAIDPDRLPEEDRPLLDAARQMAEAVGRPFERVDAPVTQSLANGAKTDINVKQVQSAPASEDDEAIDKSIAANREKLSAIDALLETAN